MQQQENQTYLSSLVLLLLFDAHVGGFWMCETRFFQASLQYSIATVQRRLLKTMSQINLHKDRWAVMHLYHDADQGTPLAN